MHCCGEGRAKEYLAVLIHSTGVVCEAEEQIVRVVNSGQVSGGGSGMEECLPL